MTFKALFLLFFLFLIASFPVVIFADNASIPVKKKVISNYKLNNPQQYFSSPSAGCSKKNKGDANCDNQIDLLDLSIWQIEFNNQKGLKSDFNHDGVVNLLDFNIWKNNHFSKATNTTSLLENLSNVLGKILSPTIFAQEKNLLGQPAIRDSKPFITSNGSSVIVSEKTDGTSSQISLDSNSNPISWLTIDSQGKIQTNSSLVNSSDEITTTSQDGIFIQTLKKEDGPTVQFFKDGNDNVLAIKSWPNLASMENNDPPLSVTLPTKDNNLLTLNVTSNGSAIIIQSGVKGNVISVANSKSDGTFVARDNRYQIESETNSTENLSKIEISNSLGGKTSYNFYKSGLFAVIQTDSAGNYYTAKPLDAEGKSWNFISTVKNQTLNQTTDDPIKKTGSNSPSPQEIVQYINYFRTISSNDNETVNFKDGFGSSDKVSQSQISQANSILKTENSSPPSLSLSNTNSGFLEIKSASAAQNTSSAGIAAAATLVPAGTLSTNGQIGAGDYKSNITISADGSQTIQILDSAGNVVINKVYSAQNKNYSGLPDAGSDVKANPTAILNFTPLGIPSTGNGGTPTFGTPVSNPNPGPTTCFLAGTKISTPGGQISIETLKPGMKIYSFNEKTNQKEISDFSGLDINFVDDYLIINEEIKTTTYHPFYVYKNGQSPLLVKAGDLRKGDLLIGEAGNLVSIYSIQKILKKTTVYNLLNVTPNDNFYAQGVLVHNYQTDPSHEYNDPGAGHEEQNITSDIPSSSTSGPAPDAANTGTQQGGDTGSTNVDQTVSFDG